MKRTLIEFFSGRTPENLISLLNERFDQIFFFYFESGTAPSTRNQTSLKDITKELLGYEAEFYPVRECRVEAALDALSDLMEAGNRYDVDLTGGNEIFVAAAGMLLEKRRDCTIFLHRYDVVRGEMLSRYPYEEKREEMIPRYLTATQILALNGTPPLSAPRPVFSYGPLRGEILRLWNAIKDRAKEWNVFCSMPCDVSGNGPFTLRKCIGNAPARRKSYNRISDALKKAEILKNEREYVRKGQLYLEFTLEIPCEALFLYDKAGNLLEMYAALCAEDSGLFHDVRVGVTADWNGTITAPKSPDPRNEIDLVLMCRNLPVLASCKNSTPINEYLYEISTMAKHYGGYFATGMLLSTEKASPTVKERAKEMGLILIDEIRKKNVEEMSRLFRNLFE